MNLAPLLDRIRRLGAYQAVLSELRANSTGRLSSPLPRAARPIVAAALASDLGQTALYLTAMPDRAHTLADEIAAWSPQLELQPFPDPDPLFYEPLPWGSRTRRLRAQTLSGLCGQGASGQDGGGGGWLILASSRALMTRTLAPKQFCSRRAHLSAGDAVEFERLLQSLVEIGYESANLVTYPGQFGRRGGILDLWPPDRETPVRIELFGEQVESLRTFDPATQRSTGAIEQLIIGAAREGLPGLQDPAWLEQLPSLTGDDGAAQSELLEFLLPWMNPTPSALLDFMPPGAPIFVDDMQQLETAISELESQALELRAQQIQAKVIPEVAPIPYSTWDEISEALSRLKVLDLGMLASDEMHDWPFEPGQKFGGKLRPLLDYLVSRRVEHASTIVISRQAERLAELWSELDAVAPVVAEISSDVQPGDLLFIKGALSEGWVLRPDDADPVQILTDAEIFGWTRQKMRRRPRARLVAPESAYADLRPGDFVVHADYGVGRFDGLVPRTLEGMPREYLLVSYAEGDQLYVPIHQADRLTRYLGVDGSAPKLSRLASQEWERARAQAKRAVEDIAKDLIDLYALRQTVIGHAYSPDTHWQQELEASFAYVETEDQVRALGAAKADMEAPRPMDRLICGDVGYGKTEVALRAAFKAVMDGKQVAMLVPTTVLAQQHFNTFRERLGAFPVVVEMLSRFRNRIEVSGILAGLQSGSIDIVIGTHRLLQKDVSFKNLGLLIIDEEQRFGVTHKEHLKQMRTEVDVLTLTATPIPRTLYMALTGVRDISTIDTPPEDRLPIVTHAGPYDPQLIRKAALRELERGGQVFFVHNRVQTIQSIGNRLERLIPEARIEVAHGQMPEQQLAQVMTAFERGEIDILLSTSIIESGLDFPNANTLIVDHADRFGLAQLYQLRGRVGRGAVRAYAYFFYGSRLRATQEALTRLETIAEQSHLGAGYSIALQDLEMRGAGDLLGRRQSGHIAAIGFHFYTQLLSAAVRRLRVPAADALGLLPADSPATQLPLPVSIDLALSSAIPPDYIPDRDLRLQLYRRLAGIRSSEQLTRIASELTDRFGAPPPEVRNLLYQLELKLAAARAGVEAISTEAGQILIQLPQDRLPVDLHSWGLPIRVSKRGIWLQADDPAIWPQQLLELLTVLADRMQLQELAAPV